MSKVKVGPDGLTDTERIALCFFRRGEDFTWPRPRTRFLTLCNLIDKGLLESRLEPAIWDSRTGCSEWKPTYKLTDKAVKLLYRKKPKS